MPKAKGISMSTQTDSKDVVQEHGNIGESGEMEYDDGVGKDNDQIDQQEIHSVWTMRTSMRTSIRTSTRTSMRKTTKTIAVVKNFRKRARKAIANIWMTMKYVIKQ